MSTLRHFVRHYSRCPSVSDIVLVWNKGARRPAKGCLPACLPVMEPPLCGPGPTLAERPAGCVCHSIGWLAACGGQPVCSASWTSTAACLPQPGCHRICLPPPQAARRCRSATLTLPCRCGCGWSRSTRSTTASRSTRSSATGKRGRPRAAACARLALAQPCCLPVLLPAVPCTGSTAASGTTALAGGHPRHPRRPPPDGPPPASPSCRAVLSLDDDIMMPCSDLERGFATWRMAPTKMVGYYPRLIEGTANP